ncbi:5-oxoprolinase subunit C family protein [Effusibacillus dendaii]|uniref:KipI antagonist n=1 Tax=Effusibacillus dendaii TaxID=2743772 RepID=A0A7I8D7Z2_9BACL|nr:biotin-dependent carboxyltransferase family protein [Effusibacillus dendaii]BCJ86234.1 KipI antagonist [Effusibacillus dendaii]
MSIQVIRPGLLTTVQDLGRLGQQKHGVIVSGAMDPFALRIANLLVGNDEREAALEITLMGPTIRFQKDCVIAICGGNLSPKIDGQPIPDWRPVWVKQGSLLQFGSPQTGCRAYLAVAGGFDVPVVMGSRSTYLRAGIGGFYGRALREGDVLPIGCRSMWEAAEWREREGRFFAGWFVDTRIRPKYGKNPTVRVMRGGEFDWFAKDIQQQFFAASFQVTPQSDRMGYRLSGPQLALSEPKELISEAVAAGTVQVPAEGNPIILLADRQTTGGYPKIAQVATVDLPILAQVTPGERIRFEEISLSQAQELYRLREREIGILRQGIKFRLDARGEDRCTGLI